MATTGEVPTPMKTTTNEPASDETVQRGERK